jgi:hypothetical protein
MKLHIWPDEADFSPREVNYWVQAPNSEQGIVPVLVIETGEQIMSRVSDKFPVFALTHALRHAANRVVLRRDSHEI